jgi:hypothetical protein
MTGDLSKVIRQFRQVISDLDRAATVAETARKHAEEANTHYVEVGRGTEHPRINQARYESQTAGQKAGKVARLLSEAARAFEEYVNLIAPGAIPRKESSPEAAPDSARILDTTRQGSRSSRLLGRVGAVPNADDGLQHAKKLGNAIQDATLPTGTATPKSTPAFVKAKEPQGAYAGDILIAALTLTIVGIRGAELARQLRRKTSSAKKEKARDNNNGREH